MRCHQLPQREHGSVDHLISIGPQLAAAAQSLRFRCLIAHVPLPDDFELIYRCPQGRVTVRGSQITTERAQVQPCET